MHRMAWRNWFFDDYFKIKARRKALAAREDLYQERRRWPRWHN